ncbi:MAG TPA: dihydroneopterin aldolase [Chitinophagaceae bacterium]|nr:dihydroneopterin aldolase [Chitinophagaceae bacterium]
MELITIELANLRFFGRHGLYKEEQKIGGEFEIDLSISYEAPSTIIHSIEQTINYTTIYLLIKKEMDEPKALLETFVMNLCTVLKKQFTQIKKIEISVKKLHPPIIQYTGTVAVKYSKEY